MPDILIIRSVSYQQLDKALPVIRQTYPGNRIHLLTHEHGAAQGRAMPGIDEVHVYPYRGGFNWRHPAPQLRGKLFDAVFIPVTNLTGAGFSNVMIYALTLKTGRRLMCNVRSELSERTTLHILGQTLQCHAYTALAACGTLLACIVALPVLLWILRRGSMPCKSP